MTLTFAACKKDAGETSADKKAAEPTATAAAGGGEKKDTREELTVGFVPVTCHLTCPVTDFASRTSTTVRFKSMRFTEFPTIVEAMKAGRLDATFINMPLAMKLRGQGLAAKIVYLGHRDGSTIMVRKDDPAKTIKDLKGKTLGIPSRFSNQHIVLHKLMKDAGMEPKDIKFVELGPPDMPTALASNAIDGYFIGEPHAAKAEMDGTGRVFALSKDIWPNFISCGLIVSEKLIAEKPHVVRELIRRIAESGVWAEAHREEAAKVSAPYFKQNEKLVKYVLTNPPDRVKYTNLTPSIEEFEEIQKYALELKIFDKAIDVKDLLDLRFIPEQIAKVELDHNQVGPDFKP
ncbi:ABC transporter substrate-binding protein [Myxococcota bacterium]|nr:ABC transporter substrate-binding protein [Myxococcota bacterium]